MRVAMVSPFPTRPAEPVGGVEAVAVCLVRALLGVRPDMDMHVIRCPAEQDATSYQQGEPTYTVHNVAGRRSVLGFRPHKGIERKLRELRPDVVHVQGYAGFVDGSRYPAVLTVHGILERDTLYRSHLFPRLRGWVLRRMNRPARRRYRHVIVIASYVMQYLREHVMGRCYFIPNPVESEFYEVSREESGPRILFIGSVIPRKNVHGLIEAIGLLAREGVDCSLRLAGPRLDGGYAQQLDGLIRRLRLAGRVDFLGCLDRPALREELQAARCLALPSFQETAPVVVSEACAVGVPTVVAPAGGTAEMVAHGYSGMVVDPRSPDSIAEGLHPLLESQDLADEFGRRARERAEVHRPERVAGQTLDVYEAAIYDWHSRQA